MVFYVYALKDPQTQKIFYVGKGQGDRAWQHQREVVNGTAKSNPAKIECIRKILASGAQVEVSLLAEYDYEEDALDHEFSLIDADPGLTNVMPRGVASKGEVSLATGRVLRLQNLLRRFVELRNQLSVKIPIRVGPDVQKIFDRLQASGKILPKHTREMELFAREIPKTRGEKAYWAERVRSWRLGSRIKHVREILREAELNVLRLKKTRRAA